MAYCEKCGTKLGDGANFCNSCGQAATPAVTAAIPDAIEAQPGASVVKPFQNARGKKKIKPLFEIPVIPSNILHSFQNQLEVGFDEDMGKKATEANTKGLFAMELLLGIGDDKAEPCFRHRVRDRWFDEIKENAFTTQLTKGEKALKSLFKWLSILPFVWIVGGMVAGGFFGKIEQYWQSLVLLPAIIATCSLIVFLIFKSSLKRKYKLEVSSDLQQAEENFNEWDLLEYAPKCAGNIDDAYSFLGKVCEKLGVDPIDAKVGLGKVKGGGSTWVGWGSGTAVGAAIGLSAISKMKASTDNAKTNSRIKVLEYFIFYNNVAVYFNSEILPSLLSSQPEILSQTHSSRVNSIPVSHSQAVLSSQAPQIVPELTKYSITTACTACGHCQSICPVEAIVEYNGGYDIDTDLCIECGACKNECPNDAIDDD